MRFTVTGLRGETETGKAVNIPMVPQKWGIHGPAQTPWVEKHVYWALPVGVVLIMSLVFAAFGKSGSLSPIRVSPVQASTSVTVKSGMTTDEVKAALSETKAILDTADQIADKLRPASSLAQTTQPLAPSTTTDVVREGTEKVNALSFADPPAPHRSALDAPTSPPPH